MNEHTPGPWVIDYNGTSGHIKSVAHRDNGSTPTVARYDIWSKYGIETELASQEQANARLIASAPDMYEALRKIVNGDYDNAHDIKQVRKIASEVLQKIDK